MKRYYKNVPKCYISHACSEGSNDAIFIKFGTVVDLTYVMTYANFGWNRLKGGHFAVVQKLPLYHDFNGWPYNRQALTCCRDRDIFSTIRQHICRVCIRRERLFGNANHGSMMPKVLRSGRGSIWSPIPILGNTHCIMDVKIPSAYIILVRKIGRAHV